MKTFFIACTLAMVFVGCASKANKSQGKDSAPTVKATAAPVPTPTPAPTPVAEKTKKIHAGKSKVASAPAPTEIGAVSAGIKTCKSGSDVRTVELKQEDKGCELIYTKAGESKTIATAKNEKNFCDGINEKLIKKLQDSGFACQ